MIPLRNTHGIGACHADADLLHVAASALVWPQEGTTMSTDRPFHLLSFEGPDRYARAGGIASRITGLAHALVGADYETHLWFVGDPQCAPNEDDGGVHLHRWCQWISHYHPGGVYDG